MKRLPCLHCDSTDLRYETLNDIWDGIESIHGYVVCNECEKTSYESDYDEAGDYDGYEGYERIGMIEYAI